jgi:ribosomal 50S subunit-recycling heat shock protein
MILYFNAVVLSYLKFNRFISTSRTVNGINMSIRRTFSGKINKNIVKNLQSKRNNQISKRKSSSSPNDAFDELPSGVRLNKCIPSLSRRGADDAIEQGRVTINGVIAKCGDRVQRGDKVCLDGNPQQWEGSAKAKEEVIDINYDSRKFFYIKYWKPKGVTCTSDLSDKDNIINAGNFHLFPQRMFTVGRLDKDSTGLILLTSDGRVNNALLSPKTKQRKVSIYRQIHQSFHSYWKCVTRNML